MGFQTTFSALEIASKLEAIINNLGLKDEHITFLNSNSYVSEFQWVLAAGSKRELKIENNGLQPFEQLKSFHKNTALFGFLAYDLKNDIENLQSNNFDGLQFPVLHFFEPKVLITQQNELLTIMADNPEKVLEVLKNAKSNSADCKTHVGEIHARISKSDYIKKVEKIKAEIQYGNIYEMNFCQEFFAENASINPFDIYAQLNELSQMPFSAFYKVDNQFVICASPERFLQKIGEKLISQPIKGTIKRSLKKEEDELLKMQLQKDEKERSENVMIVDLVRNDLSKISERGTVKVDELFGIYSYPKVHQMISTVSSVLHSENNFIDAIEATFPMGSMTGAPKISAMKIIEAYENTKRGIYSGAIGYILPNEDFDFNVVIRSILYNAENKYLSFMVGSAITILSNPENEYEECLLKAKAIFEVLNPTENA